jgi:peptide/nickel transport system ATP-binding protein
MRQRAMIAMALINDPALLIADEPTTALDVTVQAQIIELMVDLQREFGSAIIIITHDLGVVAEIAKDVLVMYAGRGVEYSTAEDVFYRPEHPYAWGLLSSVTRLDRVREERLRPIPGTPPSLLNVPKGCPFNPRCTYRGRHGIPCTTERPEMLPSTEGHLVACHLPAEERREAFLTDIKPAL